MLAADARPSSSAALASAIRFGTRRRCRRGRGRVALVTARRRRVQHRDANHERHAGWPAGTLRRSAAVLSNVARRGIMTLDVTRARATAAEPSPAGRSNKRMQLTKRTEARRVPRWLIFI